MLARRFDPGVGDIVRFLPDGTAPVPGDFDVIGAADGQLHLVDHGWGDLGAEFWDDARWDADTPKYVVVKTAEERMAEELMGR